MSRALGVDLQGRRVELERVRARHVMDLYQIVQSPDWPLAGGDLSVDQFSEHLWTSSPLQFCIVRRDTREVVGLVCGVNWDQRSGTIEVVFGVAPWLWRTAWPFEGLLLFCDYLFRGLGMRKLYFSLTESTLVKLGSGVRGWLTREVGYPDHVVAAGGGFEDVGVWSLSAWDHGLVAPLLGRAG